MLNLSSAFRDQFEVRTFRCHLGERPDAEQLRQCALLIIHYLREKHGALSGKAICSALSSGARVVRIPYVTWKPFWPQLGPDPRQTQPGADPGIFPYGDSFVSRLVQEGLPPQAIVEQYAAHAESPEFLDGLLCSNIKYIRSLETDATIDVPRLLRRIRTARLFNSFNHPRAELLLELANQILEYCHFPLLTLDAVKHFADLGGNYQVPVHPQIARHFGLQYGHQEERYQIRGELLSWEEYMYRYASWQRG
ncbi:WcbI family polysaccharide biosynthesis putative acetyltransferase [Megalodesulfovibrio paquesii]